MELDYHIELPPNIYDHPCHTQSINTNNAVVNQKAIFAGAEEFMARHICLPMYVGLTEEDAKYIANSACNLAEEVAAKKVF